MPALNKSIHGYKFRGMARINNTPRVVKVVYFYINMIDCRALRHFIFMEISAYNSYRGIGFNINYWRTKSGLEVDFILGNGEVALELRDQVIFKTEICMH